jgi:hypothetical protein
MPDRAQSELSGAALLLGIVVITVGIAGAYGVDAVTSSSDTPQVAVDGEIRTDRMTLIHQGGESVPGDDLRLRVRVNGSETSLAWADGTLTGGDARFDPGDAWRVSRSYDPDSVVVVRLIHRPSNGILFRTERNPTTPTVVSGDGGKADARDTDGEIPVGIGTDDTGTDDEAETSLRVRVDDLTNRDTDNPRYVVSYDAPVTNDSFDRVEVEFGSGPNADSATRTGGSERGSVSFRGGYGQNEEYTITVRTYYTTDGGGTTVGRKRIITDRADTYNPENDDLSESDSPVFKSSTAITDRSDPEPDRVRYRFDYDVDTRGNFEEVLVGIVNRDGVGGTAVRTVDRSSGTEDLQENYGTDTKYKATILVFDADGAVVDTKTRIDEADGDGGNGPGNSGSNPGNSGSNPGNSGSNPGNSGSNPGNSGSNPGKGP